MMQNLEFLFFLPLPSGVATQCKGQQGWPGTSTEESLKKARVELKVKENH
jgi:hypothetical protein